MPNGEYSWEEIKKQYWEQYPTKVFWDWLEQSYPEGLPWEETWVKREVGFKPNIPATLESLNAYYFENIAPPATPPEAPPTEMGVPDWLPKQITLLDGQTIDIEWYPSEVSEMEGGETGWIPLLPAGFATRENFMYALGQVYDLAELGEEDLRAIYTPLYGDFTPSTLGAGGGYPPTYSYGGAIAGREITPAAPGGKESYEAWAIRTGAIPRWEELTPEQQAREMIPKEAVTYPETVFTREVKEYKTQIADYQEQLNYCTSIGDEDCVRIMTDAIKNLEDWTRYAGWHGAYKQKERILAEREKLQAQTFRARPDYGEIRDPVTQELIRPALGYGAEGIKAPKLGEKRYAPKKPKTPAEIAAEIAQKRKQRAQKREWEQLVQASQRPERIVKL